jgi:glutamate racemase
MKPIGVFDSGYGGLSVLEEIRKQLPEYDYLYLGDNARSPYGSRSFDVIYEYTWEAVQLLFANGCELVVLACNTASAKALRSIQQKQLPLLGSEKRVLGVIRPSTEILGSLTRSKHFGLLATEGTVKSDSYRIELGKFSPEVLLTQHACPMWVSLIEQGEQNTEGGQYFIERDVKRLLTQDPKIDTILLGCTHYPWVKTQVEEIAGRSIQVIAQGALVAERLKDYLDRHKKLASLCSKEGTTRYLTTENPVEFSEKASNLLGFSIFAEKVDLS